MILYENNYLNNSSACALVAPAIKGTPLTIKKFCDFRSLTQEFGTDSIEFPLVSMAKVLFLNNVSTIYCLPPSINEKPTKDNYIETFKMLKELSDVYCIICDTDDPEVITELSKSIDDNSNKTPKLGFIGLKSNPEQSIATVNDIGHPKLIFTNCQTCLTSRPELKSTALTSAGLAALVASISNPLENLTDTPILGLTIMDHFSKPLIAKLTNSGVSSIKYIRDKLYINKLLPSKPLSKDYIPNINHLLILDAVKISIINLVSNIKNSQAFNFLSCKSLNSQIILLLSDSKDLGLISDFQKPIISITSTIDITTYIKPESLFDNNFIPINITI